MGVPPLSAALAAVDHPSWCDPAQCTASGRGEFHPASPPPAHAGRRYVCKPPPGRYGTEVTLQLVRYVDDDPAVDFVRLGLGDPEGRQSFYVRLSSQGEAIRDALGEILTTARESDAATGAGSVAGHEPGA